MLNYLKSFITHPDEKLPDDFKDRPRFTYRSDFSPILETSIISDCGWGCCYRCAQGIISKYMMLLHSINPTLIATNFNQIENTLSLFLDTDEAPFSIQNLVKETSQIGVSIGQWAKPSQVAQAFGNIFGKYNIPFYFSCDCIIEPSKLQQGKYPMILMVSLMCSLASQFDESFFPFMKYIFSLKEIIGIVSGYSGSAYYIVKINDSEEVFYFDPHVCQPAAVSSDSFDTFFNQKVMKMPLSQLNPSILMAFICTDYKNACELVKSLVEFPNSPISFSEKISDEILDQVLDIDDLDLQ